MTALPGYYTVPEFAKKKGISTTSVYRAIEDGRIKPTYVGRKKIVFIPPAELKVQFRLNVSNATIYDKE